MIILTGFEPYGRFKENISNDIVNKLVFPKLQTQIMRQILPVSWDLSFSLYKSLLMRVNADPKLVIMLGIHTKKNYSLEKYGWNLVLGNDVNNKVKAGIIRLDSPLFMKSIINIKQVYLILKQITCISISFFPGTYLCNYIYYLALLLSKKRYPVLFIHIPYKEDLDRGIEVIRDLIETIISVQNIRI
ncbi:MAG: hypothetical protein ACFE8N_02155 [Promethearchaeota archaeon]